LGFHIALFESIGQINTQGSNLMWSFRNKRQNNVAGSAAVGSEIVHGRRRKAANTDRREGWSQQPESISPGDRRAIQTLLSALTPLSDLRDRPIPLPFAVVFLSIVLNEGQPVGRYAKDLNMTRYAALVHSIYWRSRTP
jgi:hypothetical protein